jgi:membrane protein YqaA with SNARE-associated domain
VPIVGDPITVVAGVLREPLPTFLLLVTIAKLGRYVIVALATMNLA